MNITQDQFYKYVVTILKQLNLPFTDPCDASYTGDCGPCGGGGGSDGVLTGTSLVGTNLILTTSVGGPYTQDLSSLVSTLAAGTNPALTLTGQEFNLDLGAVGSYVNTASGLTATSIQGAIDEIVAGTYTPPTYTTGSILFASPTGEPTEDNANLFFNDATNSLLIGTNNPTITPYPYLTTFTSTSANFVGLNTIGDFESSFALFTDGIQNSSNSHYAINRGRQGGIEIVSTTNVDHGNFTLSLADGTWNNPESTGRKAGYAGLSYSVEGTGDRELQVTQRPAWALFNASPINNTDSTKTVAVMGIDYVTQVGRSTHRGGSYVMFPNYNTIRNNYVDQIPNNVAYFNDFGVLSRTTPGQLQVANPITSTTTDLDIALANIVTTPTHIVEEPAFTPATNTFSVTVTPQALNQCQVFIGGQKIANSQLTLTGNTFTLTSYTLNAGDIVEVVYINY